jgi:hypothetical protein
MYSRIVIDDIQLVRECHEAFADARRSEAHVGTRCPALAERHVYFVDVSVAQRKFVQRRSAALDEHHLAHLVIVWITRHELGVRQRVLRAHVHVGTLSVVHIVSENE